jgi:serralysin
VSLSADGSRVAIGAQFNGVAGSNAGHVRIYSSTAPNVSPVFSSGTVGSGVAGVASSVYTAVATDADGNPLTYTLGSAVAGFAINSSTGVVSMGAGVVAGSYVLNVVVSDGTAFVTRTVTVTVSAAPNVSPVFTSGLTGSGVAGVASSVYTAVATDANGDTVTYSLGTVVAGFTINSSTGVVSMGAGVVAGSYVLNVVASDGTASVTQVVTVTVSPAAVLARTGSDIGGLSTGALALLILGLIAVAFTRRQERGNGFLIS